MDNVLNRPLFRHREARDRLNESIGVQRFEIGGVVSADPSGAITRQYRQRPIRPEGLPPSVGAQENISEYEKVMLPGGEGPAGEFLYNRATGDVLMPDGSPLGIPGYKEVVAAKIQNYLSDGGPEAASLRSGIATLTDMGAQASREGFTGRAMDLAEQTRELREREKDLMAQPRPSAYKMDRGVLAAEGPEALMSQLPVEDQQKTLDIFSRLDRAAEKPAPELTPKAPPKPGEVAPVAVTADRGMETEARGSRPRGPVPIGQEGPDFERTGRQGSLVADPAAVAAGLNAEDPAIREKTVQDFMKEYTSTAPEYKGMDKNLMLAQIGFAIAAGESPNAMQNIANGLLAGSDMMLKDKAAKDEFDRQVQLSAMQYGFGEVSKERELGRQFTDYVASKPVTYRGKTYGPNESVPVLHSDIINGRMPDGVVTEATSDALATNFGAIQKALVEQVKNKTLSGQEYEAAINKLDTAAKDYTSATNMIPLLEASLERVNDEVSGGVTGADAWLYTTINKISNFIGLNPADQLENVEKYNADMESVAVQFASEILGESGRTISDQDRLLIQDLVGLIKSKDFVSAYAKDPDILTSKLQKLIRRAEKNRDNALGSYTTTMRGYTGAYSPGGAEVYSDVAEQTFSPEALDAPQIEFEWDPENPNRLRLKR